MYHWWTSHPRRRAFAHASQSKKCGYERRRRERRKFGGFTSRNEQLFSVKVHVTANIFNLLIVTLTNARFRAHFLRRLETSLRERRKFGGFPREMCKFSANKWKRKFLKPHIVTPSRTHIFARASRHTKKPAYTSAKGASKENLMDLPREMWKFSA